MIIWRRSKDGSVMTSSNNKHGPIRPTHVAIIMDGNGRWATRRGLTRIQGHRRGKDSVRAIVEKAREIGIEYLTLYAFSSENWQRPEREVGALMQLLRRYLRSEVAKMMRYGIRRASRQIAASSSASGPRRSGWQGW